MSPPVIVLCAILTPLVGVALLNLWLARRLHRLAPARPEARVSVLVPARDEAANLRRLLPALRASRHIDLEVLVLDDGSRDATRAVVREHAALDPRVRLIEGAPLPAGWTGKNWACHQLAHHARGEILLFCDADVVPGPDAVARTVTAIATDGADVVTAFPWHEPGGWFEEAVIPAVTQLPVAALLPLPLVRSTRAVSLSVGNGQWMAWRREAYERIGGHLRVRGDVLEDVRLAREAKRDGLRLLPLVATRDLAIRMYRGRSETRDGFGKNLYLLAGGTDATLAAALTLYVAAGALPLVLPALTESGSAAWVPLALLAGVRLATAALFEDGVRSVLLHPVSVAAVAALALVSRTRHRRGSVWWKKRLVTAEGTGR